MAGAQGEASASPLRPFCHLPQPETELRCPASQWYALQAAVPCLALTLQAGGLRRGEPAVAPEGALVGALL